MIYFFKSLPLIALLILHLPICVFGSEALRANVRIKKTDGSTREALVQLEDKGKFFSLTMPRESLEAGIETIDILPEFTRANIGEDGYCVLPNGMLTKFGKRKDGFMSSAMLMRLSGFKKADRAYAAIIKGMANECAPYVQLKEGTYRLGYRFKLKAIEPYEDIIIDFYPLNGKDANYSAMGRLYRKWQLDRGEVRPLKERALERPELAYAAGAPEIRIRQGWKPYPSPVAEQTPENEPKMKVKVTFDRVCEIMDELKRQGVDKAQICLVGWNIRGHDGRWPQSFPVEPALGGEEKLRALIKKGQSMGFQVVCHSNAVGACQIADCFSKDDISRDSDGKLRKSNIWSGGQYYRICPKQYRKKISKQNIEKIAALGFRGLHYIDVISITSPVPCFDPRHPASSKESGECWSLELSDAAKLMGGAASEGGYDHAAKNLDFALYITFNLEKIPAMADCYVPLWHIVYNGIILSNAASATVNYPLKAPEVAMKVAEFATRPTFYFYSAFSDKPRGNWMGDTDLKCSTEEELKRSVSAIKKGYDLMLKIGRLQYEFLESHEEIAPMVFKSLFSDSTEIICNYSAKAFSYRDKAVSPLSYEVFFARK